MTDNIGGLFVAICVVAFAVVAALVIALRRSVKATREAERCLHDNKADLESFENVRKRLAYSTERAALLERKASELTAQAENAQAEAAANAAKIACVEREAEQHVNVSEPVSEPSVNVADYQRLIFTCSQLRQELDGQTKKARYYFDDYSIIESELKIAKGRIEQLTNVTPERRAALEAAEYNFELLDKMTDSFNSSSTLHTHAERIEKLRDKGTFIVALNPAYADVVNERLINADRQTERLIERLYKQIYYQTYAGEGKPDVVVVREDAARLFCEDMIKYESTLDAANNYQSRLKDAQALLEKAYKENAAKASE